MGGFFNFFFLFIFFQSFLKRVKPKLLQEREGLGQLRWFELERGETELSRKRNGVD